MLLYDPLLEIAMPRYGILIPIPPSRPQKITAFLAERHSPLPVMNLKEAALGIHTLGIQEGGTRNGGIQDGPVIEQKDLERVHDRAFIAKLYGGSEEKEKALLTTYELINSDGTYNRYNPSLAVKPLADLFDVILRHVEGSYLASRLALEKKGKAPYEDFCFFLSGGMHHARYDSGSGFCLVNDIIIAARKLQAEDRAAFIWIIDVDAHKGDGSAELVKFSRDRGESFADRNPGIFTLSVHMARGWPLDSASLAAAEKGRAPLVDSDLDIPIEEKEDDLYITRLADGLAEMERRSGNRKPDLAIVVAGADPYEKDGLPSSGLLALSLDQCVERDRLILSFLKKRKIPSAWILAGGYGEHAWEPTARFLDSLAERPIRTGEEP
ncbi:MAG: histone deacetylase [Spirochaetaceae bacterium]|nr:histone deacetylase [Spirochaetaceae bacterium]